MERIYQGKTKDVYRLNKDQVLLQFKDDVTGENGIFDPGANSVGLTIEGMGQANLRMSVHYFTMLQDAGIATHFVSADLSRGTMVVLAAAPFGKGVEVICRKRAVGSFIRRYGSYIEPGTELNDYVEFTLKDDARNDPLITKEGLEVLGILTNEHYDGIVRETKRITNLIAKDLAQKGLELYDIKLEFGIAGDKIVLIDEISSGNMRAMDHGKNIEALELTRRVLGEV